MLVVAGIRKSFMVQSIDYGEYKGTGPKTEVIVNNLRYVFPELLTTNTHQGIIFSLGPIGILHDDYELGVALSFPSPGEMDGKFSVHYEVHIDGKTYDLLSCISNAITPAVNELADKIRVFVESLGFGFVLIIKKIYTDAEVLAKVIAKDTVKPKLQWEVLSIYGNNYMSLLCILQEKKEIDLFSAEWRPFMVRALKVCVDMITDEEVGRNTIKWLVKVLTRDHELIIDPADIASSTRDYFMD